MARYFPFFYHEQMRKYCAVFGTIFNEIDVVRFKADGTIDQRKTVPIAYGPRDKALARQDEEPEFNQRKAAIVYPRMTFEMTGFTYDSDRKIGSEHQYLLPDGTVVGAPSPWNITFDLVIGVNTIDEGNQIIEQIIPMFNPELNSSVEILPGVLIDVPLVLEGVSKTDNWEGSVDGRRDIRWILSFSMRVRFFGPITTKKLIKFVDVSFHPSNDSSTGEAQSVYPGLTATGEGTTDPEQAVDWSTVNIDDGWKVIVQVRDIDDE